MPGQRMACRHGLHTLVKPARPCPPSPASLQLPLRTRPCATQTRANAAAVITNESKHGHRQPPALCVHGERREGHIMRLTATQPDTSASCPCTCHPASHCVLAAQLMGRFPPIKK